MKMADGADPERRERFDETLQRLDDETDNASATESSGRHHWG